MTGFEYKVVPAPMRGLKGKGIKGTPARFANALQSLMNDLGSDGWEYQRTDTLPVEERQGLTGKATSFQNMLVFRRALEVQAEDTPDVAALIEDQTDVLVEAAEPVIITEDIAAITDTETPTADDLNTDSAQDVVGPPVTSATQDRVSETLKATSFVFPWNKRRNAAGPHNENDTHHPAD